MKNDQTSRRVLGAIKRLKKIKKTNTLGNNMKDAKKAVRDFLHIVDNELESQLEVDYTSKSYEPIMLALIEHDANPVNPLTDEEFAGLHKIETSQMKAMRIRYPHYSIAVMYRRKKYQSNLGNFCMQALAQRIAEGSDLALKMGLEISGEYTPKQTLENIDASDPNTKRQRLGELLRKIEKFNEEGSASDNSEPKPESVKETPNAGETGIVI